MNNRTDAVYVRKSSDPQEEASQINAIRDYLNRHHIHVPEANWFVEVGQRHRPEDRPQFQRLMRLVEQGRIARVFVWKQNRVVSGVKLWFKYLYEFERTATQLIDILTGKDLAADDVTTEIETTIGARKARDDVKQLAEDVMRARMELAKEGMPQSKYPPFGYDKLYNDQRGNHLWTAHLLDSGRWLITNPDGSSVERERAPRKAKSDRIKYVPSRDRKRVELVRIIFRIYATESISERGIALRLNQSNRLHYGKPWIRTTILEILRNPAYIGAVRNFAVTQAEFATYDGEKIVRANNPDKKTIRTPDREIVVPDQHEPIIDRQTWNTVQEKLRTRKTRRQPPRREDLWLRGILVCATCKQPMHLFTGNKKKAAHVRGYICSSYYYYNQTHAERFNTGCTRNFLSHERAEQLVKDKLGRLLDDVTNTDEATALQDLRFLYGDEERRLHIVLSDGLGRYWLHVHEIFRELGKEKAFAQLAARVKKAVGLGKMKDEELAHYFGDGKQPRLDLFRKYFILFEEEKTKAARQKADELKAEFDNWVKAKVHAQSDRERERINATLRRLEADIEKWEAQSIALDDQLAEVRSRLADYRSQIEATAKVLSGSENLRKAELVRRMFKAIVLCFRPIKKAKIRDCEFLPEKTEFVDNLQDGSV